MTISNNVKKIIDLPSWEWVRAAPAVTAASATTASGAISDWKSYFVGGTPRYGYYLVGTALYRYDTWNDSWNQLASMTVTPIYCASVEYSPNAGYYGFAIGPGPGRNTIQLAGLDGETLVGQKIAIIAGTGAGQERTIVDMKGPFIHDSGSVGTYTAGPNPASIADTSTLTQRKTWIYNQWRNYQMRVAYTSSTGSNQTRKILYNNGTTLTFSDYNFAPLHSWYCAPLSTAITNAQAWYQIESSIASVDTPWVTRPDETSMFVIRGGGIWLYTGLATGAFYTLAYYDILADTWYYKGTQTATLLSNTWSTFESSMEVVTEAEGGATTDWSHATPLTSNQGAISVASAPYDRRTLVDAGQNMNPNQYANQMIKITGGVGRGQSRTIVGNSRTTFIVSRNWDTTPDSTSTYQVIGDSDKIYVLPGRTQSVMGMYNIENDMMTTGRQFDSGVAREIYIDPQYKMIATVAVTNGGTSGTYAVGDILTLTNNGLYYGLNGQVRVETLTGSQVATVSLWSAGRGYAASGTAYATTGGGGAGCTITVLSNGIPSMPPVAVSSFGAVGTAVYSVSVNAPGSGYSVGDILNLVSGSGTGGSVRVTGVDSVGGLTSVSVEFAGIGFTTPAVATTTLYLVRNATATDFRAQATGATINIDSLSATVQATASSNNLKPGDIIYVGGMSQIAGSTTGGLKVFRTAFSGGNIIYYCAGAEGATLANVTPTIVNGAISTAVVNAGGTGYSIGDELTLTTGGSNGKVRVVAVNGGIVTGVTLLAIGSGYSAGSSATTGGGNNDCTITIAVGDGKASGAVTVNTPGQGYGTLSNVNTTPYTYSLGTGLTSVSIYNGGSGYAVGDLLAISGGDGKGIIKVINVNANGAVVNASFFGSWIYSEGSGYSVGTQKATINLGNVYSASNLGGDVGGAGCTVNIDSVGFSVAEPSFQFTLSVTSISSSGGILAATAQYSQIGITGSYNIITGGNSTTSIASINQNANQIADLTKNWVPNEHVGKLVQTQLSGVAATAQMRRIIANSAYTLIVSPGITVPTNGSTKYVIFDPKSLGTETTYKCQDCSQYSWGIATGGTINTIIDNPSGLGVLNVVNGGSGYTVGDILTLSGGTGGTAKVITATSGTVTAVSVITQGTGYTANTTSTTTSAPTGGTGCTLYIYTLNSKNWEINRWAGYKVKIVAGTGSNVLPNELLISSNTANTLTLAPNFWFVSGSVDTITATSGGVAASLLTQNTEVTTDGDSDEDNVTLANGYIGQIKTIYCKTVGNAADSLKITPVSGATVSLGVNPVGKSTTLVYTVGGWVATTNSLIPDSTTVYSIMDNYGVCTGTTTNGGVSTVSINAGGTGYRVGDIIQIAAGTGSFLKVSSISAGGIITGVQIINPGSGQTVATQNTACPTNSGGSGCTLNITGTTTAGSTTIINDPYQNWSGNLVNKMVRIVAGTIVTGFDNIIASSASSTQITGTTAYGSATDGDCVYSILGVSTRSAAASVGSSSLHRLWGTSVIEKARYMISWRGNTTPSIDRYDIVQNMWETLSGTPLSETLTLGSMFIYNGRDRIYFTTSVLGRVQYYDFSLNKIIPCGTTPYVHGTGIQGNRMFIMSSSDLDSYTVEALYIMRHSGSEMWRAFIY